MAIEIIYSYDGMEEQKERLLRLRTEISDAVQNVDLSEKGCAYEEMLDELQCIINRIRNSLASAVKATEDFLAESMERMGKADTY